MKIVSWEFESPPLHFLLFLRYDAAIAQLVEHNLAKVGVASSSLVCRSFFYTFRKSSFLLVIAKKVTSFVDKQ